MRFTICFWFFHWLVSLIFWTFLIAINDRRKNNYSRIYRQMNIIIFCIKQILVRTYKWIRRVLFSYTRIVPKIWECWCLLSATRTKIPAHAFRISVKTCIRRLCSREELGLLNETRGIHSFPRRFRILQLTGMVRPMLIFTKYYFART